MHDDEVDIDVAVVEALVATQFPGLADLPIRTIPEAGTVNAIYRLGDDLCVRLPRLRDWSATGDRELTWLPVLAPQLTLPIPEPVGRGSPGCGYPFGWAIYRWIDGTPYDPHPDTDTDTDNASAPADDTQLADDLAAFVLELRRVDTTGAPPAGRRPLAELDDATRAAIDACGDAIDRAAATAAWDRALEAPAWDGAPVWIHNDLLPTNLLVDTSPELAPESVVRATESGASSPISTSRLAAVIDFGGAGAGDPAADVVPAWSVFGPVGRAAYRAALGVDDGTWARARGYALHQAALIIPYYAATNPAFVTMAVRTVGQVLADPT